MSSGPRIVKVLQKDLPPVIRIGDDRYGYLTRYRIVSEDKNRFSEWSKVFRIEIPEPETISGDISKSGNIIQVAWQGQRSSHDIFVGFGFEINHKKLIDNVATVYTDNPHNIIVGSTVTISEALAPFNGTFVVSAVGENTISYPLTSSNINYHPAHGIARSYQYSGSSESNQYTFLTNVNAENVKVSVQISSINQERSDFLTVFESSELSLV